MVIILSEYVIINLMNEEVTKVYEAYKKEFLIRYPYAVFQRTLFYRIITEMYGN